MSGSSDVKWFSLIQGASYYVGVSFKPVEGSVWRQMLSGCLTGTKVNGEHGELPHWSHFYRSEVDKIILGTWILSS